MANLFYIWYDKAMRYAIWCTSVVFLIVCVLEGCATGIKAPRHAKAAVRNMEITGYCKCGECCGWQRNWRGKPVINAGPNKGDRKKIGQTASGKQARYGTIAADTSHYPFGTVIYVPGYGYGRVEDRGGDIKGPNRLDLFFKDHKGAQKWGRQTKKVKIWTPRR